MSHVSSFLLQFTLPYCATEQLCLISQKKTFFLPASWGWCASDVKLWGTILATLHLFSNPASPHRTNSNSLFLTDVNHIYVHWVWKGAAQRIGGHNGDVVVDPDGCVILVEEAGVLSGCVVVRAFVHSIWAVGGNWERFVRTWLHKVTRENEKTEKELLSTEGLLDPKSEQLFYFLSLIVILFFF